MSRGAIHRTSHGHCVFSINEKEDTMKGHHCYGECHGKKELPLIEMERQHAHCIYPIGGNRYRMHYCHGECSRGPRRAYPTLFFR